MSFGPAQGSGGGAAGPTTGGVIRSVGDVPTDIVGLRARAFNDGRKYYTAVPDGLTPVAYYPATGVSTAASGGFTPTGLNNALGANGVTNNMLNDRVQVGHVIGASLGPFRLAFRPWGICKVHVQASHGPADIRLWVGHHSSIVDTTISQNDDPGTNHFGLLFSEGVRGGNWSIVHRGAGAQSVLDTGVAFAVDTVYIIEWYYDGTLLHYIINGQDFSVTPDPAETADMTTMYYAILGQKAASVGIRGFDFYHGMISFQ